MVIDSERRAYGRAQAFQHIGDGIGKASEGFGAALVVTGSRRTGRSHFMDDVKRMHDGPTVFIAGTRQTCMAPIDVLHPLFAHLGIRVSELPAKTVIGDAMAAYEWGAAIGDVILSALATYDPNGHALLIVVDDADLLSPSCRSVLGYVARRLANLPAFAILVCDGDDTQLRSLPRLPIYTLTLEESGALIESFIGYRPPLHALVGLHRSCRGNPADLRELCEQATTEQLRGVEAPPWPLLVAPCRMNRWRDTFAQLAEVRRLALLILSVVRTMEPDDLLRILAAEAGRSCNVDVEFAALIESGHLSSVGHEVWIASHLDRAAIYRISPLKLRAECHRVISAYSLLRGRPALSAIDRLVAGDTAADNVEEIIRLTRELSRDDDSVLTIHILRELVKNSSDDRAARIALHGLELATMGGYFYDAGWFAKQAHLQMLPPMEAAAMTALRMKLCFLQDEPLDAEWACRIVADISDSCPQAAADLSNSAALYYFLRHDAIDARRILLSVSNVGSLDPSERRMTLLAMVDRRIAEDAVGDPGRCQLPKIELRQSQKLFPTSETAAYLFQLGRFQEGKIYLDRLSRQVVSPVERVITLTLRVDNEIFSGTVDAAQQLWEEGQLLLPMDDCLHMLRLCQGVHILGLAGRFTEAADMAEGSQAHPHRRVQRAYESRLLWALGQIALMKGDADASISLLEQSIDLLSSVTDYWQVQRCIDLVEALMAANCPVRAEHTLRSLELQLGAQPPPAIAAVIARGRLLIARTPYEARVALPQALGTCAHHPTPPIERARVHAIYAHRFGRLEDDSSESRRRHQRIADALFSRIGASGWMEPGALSPARTAPRMSRISSGAAPVPKSILQEALAIISSDYTDAELTTQTLAKRLGVSARTLHRTFESHPRSVAQLIRSRRIDRAVDLLQDARQAHLSLSDIARISGAPSVAYVRTGIKEKHNVNPSQLRSAAALSGSPTSPAIV